VVLEKDGEDHLDWHVRKEEVLRRIKERSILQTKKKAGYLDWSYLA
jgi:hypothetical protein